jgi:hypothetical protein
VKNARERMRANPRREEVYIETRRERDREREKRGNGKIEYEDCPSMSFRGDSRAAVTYSVRHRYTIYHLVLFLV